MYHLPPPGAPGYLDGYSLPVVPGRPEPRWFGGYEQDVIEALSTQGVLDEKQAQALRDGLGRPRPAESAWPPPAGPQPVNWGQAAAVTGGAFVAGLVAAKLFARLF